MKKHWYSQNKTIIFRYTKSGDTLLESKDTERFILEVL